MVPVVLDTAPKHNRNKKQKRIHKVECEKVVIRFQGHGLLWLLKAECVKFVTKIYSLFLLHIHAE